MEESLVMFVFAESVRPAASMRIGEVQVDNLTFRYFEDTRIFILFAEVVVVDDHFHIRMFHPAHHLQSFSASIDDVALLSPQWLYGNHDIRSLRNVPCHF